MGESGVHPWMSYQFIVRPYVSNCELGVLLKSTSAVLCRGSGLTYYQNILVAVGRSVAFERNAKELPESSYLLWSLCLTFFLPPVLSCYLPW